MADPVISIRHATRDDLDRLVAGNLALALETEAVRLDADTLRRGVESLLTGRAPGEYWVAELDGVPVGQTLITFEWSDWRNRLVWWIQSVYVRPEARAHGVFRAIYRFLRHEANAAGAAGLRLYVDTSNTRAQAVYAALGMNGGHYRVFEDMFDEPARDAPSTPSGPSPSRIERDRSGP